MLDSRYGARCVALRRRRASGGSCWAATCGSFASFDPFDPLDPSGPFDPSAPFDPFDPLNPLDPLDPLDPLNPLNPLNPFNPLARLSGSPACVVCRSPNGRCVDRSGTTVLQRLAAHWLRPWPATSDVSASIDHRAASDQQDLLVRSGSVAAHIVPCAGCRNGPDTAARLLRCSGVPAATPGLLAISAAGGSTPS